VFVACLSASGTFGCSTSDFPPPPAPAGELDSFNASGVGPDNIVYDVTAAGGKVYINGVFSRVNGVLRAGIARLNNDGTLDTSFVPPAMTFADYTAPGAPTPRLINQIAVLSDGKVLIAGAFRIEGGVEGEYPWSGLARLNSDGSIDTDFVPPVMTYASGNRALVINALAVQSDGKILLGGNVSNVSVAGVPARVGLLRLNADLTLDTSFVPPAITKPVLACGCQHDGGVETLLVRPDGKILIGGDFTLVGGTTRNRVALLEADGTLNADFNPDLNQPVYALALDFSNRLLIGGLFSTVTGSARVGLARLAADGTLDTLNPFANFDQFGDNPRYVHSILIQPDGKIVVAGTAAAGAGFIARVNGDGTLDSTLALSASNSFYGLARQTDGKLVIAGAFSSVADQTRIRVARVSS
jgi:uncharacterized delta-60 repeat protein